MTRSIVYKKNIDAALLDFIRTNWKRSFGKSGRITPCWDEEMFRWRARCQTTPLFVIEYVDGKICSLVCILKKKVLRLGEEKILVNVCWATSSIDGRSGRGFLKFCVSAIEGLPFKYDSIVFSALIGRTDKYWMFFSERLGRKAVKCGEYSILIKQLNRLYPVQKERRSGKVIGWLSFSEIHGQKETLLAWAEYLRKKCDTTSIIEDRFVSDELSYSNVSKTFAAKYGNAIVGLITITKEFYCIADEKRCSFNIRFVDDERIGCDDRVRFYEYVFDYCASEGADVVRIATCISNSLFFLTRLDFVDSNQHNAVIGIGDVNIGMMSEYADGVYDII